jgi:photosystem II stability/assembly factor-like uncharacterized protein
MRRHSRSLSTAIGIIVSATVLAGQSAQAEPRRDLTWVETVVDAGQSFRGLDAVNRKIAWITGGSIAAGGPGTVWRTTDGGATWQNVSPPESEGLLFRDVAAFGAKKAVVLSIGPGEASRIYQTTDGGQTWTETFRNTEEEAFYNCLDFFPGGRHGLAMSDPVDGKFRILGTKDGGRSWQVLPDEGMPDSTGEFGFSASGDCLVIQGHDAWFGSGGSTSRIFHSTDRGLTWEATGSTIPAGEAAGVFGLAFKSPRHGVAVGGDFAAPDDGTDATAFTTNGRTWRNGGDLTHLGEDAAWLGRNVLVVGESGDIAGSSISRDGGRTWQLFSDVGFHTLDCTADGSCWAAGGGGRVGRL